MKKSTFLFCNGPSGSGKTYFIENALPCDLFYVLKSATTRPMRTGESEGHPYFFRDEDFFETEPLATRLWVNQEIWVPGQKKWLYGVPENEIFNNLGKNLIYDVIEPRYTRQMIDWFRAHNLSRYYNFKIAYFLPPSDNVQIIKTRANMPDDTIVRQKNTCTPVDFVKAGLDVDYMLMPREGIGNQRLMAHIDRLKKTR